MTAATGVGLNGFEYLLAKAREKREKERLAEGRPMLKDQYISVPGHEIPSDSLSKRTTVGKIAHMALEYGWEVKVGESEYVTAERWVKGAVVPGKPMKWNWCQGMSPDRKHLFSASSLYLRIDKESVDDKDLVLIHIQEYGNATHSGA